jgi:hypothetical protein
MRGEELLRGEQDPGAAVVEAEIPVQTVPNRAMTSIIH